MLDTVTSKSPVMAAAGFVAAVALVGVPGYAAVAATKSGTDLPAADAATTPPSASATPSSGAPAESASPAAALPGAPAPLPADPGSAPAPGATTVVIQTPGATKTVTAAPNPGAATPQQAPAQQAPAQQAPVIAAPVVNSDYYTFTVAEQEQAGCPTSNACAWYLDVASLIAGQWTTLTVDESGHNEIYAEVVGTDIYVEPNAFGYFLNYVYFTVTGPGGSARGYLELEFEGY